jgi:tetratricopeptide (TPR) repeat protein
LIVSVAVLANAASAFIEPTNPALALRLNPLNSAARISLAAGDLADGTPGALRSARELILAGLRLSPADARFYSLMGLVELRRGDRKSAELSFSRAHQLLPTEIQALGHKLQFAIEARDFSEAVDYVEVFARRWPQRWARVEAVLPVLLSDGPAFDKLAARFADEPELRDLLLESLSASAKTLPFAYRLIMTWFGRGSTGLDGGINRLTKRFIEEKRYAQAFLLFRLTRGRSVGYVTNGGFDQPLSGNPFDWCLRPQAGVDLRFEAKQPPQSGHSEDGEAVRDRRLAIRFLDTPVRFRNVSQWLRLAPAHYRLTVRYAARDLSTPRPLGLSLACLEGGKPLAEIALDDGTFAIREETVDFVVPAGDCALQQLVVSNGPMPMSWQDRYSGTLYLEKVSVSRAGS